MDIRNGIFLPIPAETELPAQYRPLPDEYTTRRICRWSTWLFSNEQTKEYASNKDTGH